jgi:4-amino-4-deoxy-L-arabinose transferase-like glycosyltransferase
VTSTLYLIPNANRASGNRHSYPLSKKAWDRIGLAVLLVGTAVTYLWGITINGLGNQFYAAAAQAGSMDWEALLFGSLDSHNFITVDKPPVSQWVMGVSGQIFGFSSASMLIPEALMGVASVALLYAAIRRISGPNAALLAGAALALTPVAALMFRYNNPDAVMLLLMIAAAYCTVRALEHAGAKWIALAGVALGFAFLAKMLEGLMVVPAIGLAYLIAAPTPLRRRVVHLVGAGVAFAVSAGWFVVLTLLWPAASRPYIAGSTDNNFMNLVLGYNGFGRVLGHNHKLLASGPAIGASAGARVRLGSPFGMRDQVQGAARLISGEFGFEISWLLPAALLAVVLVIVLRGRAPRTDLARAGAVLFGGWLLVDGLVLSFMHTQIPPYYCMSLAAAVAGMFAIGIHQTWLDRTSLLGRYGLAAMLLVTGVWSWWVLGRNQDWLPPLRWTILFVAVAAAIALPICMSSQARQRWAVIAVTAGLIGGLLGSAGYAIATIGQPHNGPLVIAGPDSQSRAANEAMGSWLSVDNPELDALLRATHTEWSAAILRASPAAGLELSTNTEVMAIGGFLGNDPVPTLQQFQGYVARHQIRYFIVAQTSGPGPRGNQHADITDWVKAHFTSAKAGSVMVYDLTAPIKS